MCDLRGLKIQKIPGGVCPHTPLGSYTIIIIMVTPTLCVTPPPNL